MNTASKQWRHETEVRHCIRMGYAWFSEYITGVRKARGPEAAKRLWDDVKQQAAAGNTGRAGEWKTAPEPAQMEIA